MGFRRLLIPLIFVVLALTIIFFLVKPTPYLVGAFVIDDGMYYLEVPRNVVSGHGVTYDNHTITNGFHPLWGGICLLIALVSGAETEPFFRLAMIVQALFMLLSLFLFWRIAVATRMETMGVILALMALFFARLDLFLSTMESATLLLTTLLLIWLALRRDLLRSNRWQDNVLLGLLLALVFLARLDTIFIVFAFLAAQAASKIRKEWRGLKSPLISGLVFTLLTSPYLAVNQIYFGSIVPVSGMKKMSDASTLTENFSTVSSNMLSVISGKLHIPSFLLVAGIVLAIVVFAWLCLRTAARPCLSDAFGAAVLPAFFLGTVLRGLYLLTYVQEYTFVPWYWVPEYVVVCLVIGVASTVIIRSLAWTWLSRTVPLYVISMAILFVGSGYLISDARRHQESGRIVYDCALWASDRLEKDVLFAMNDSGIFSFFSNYDVIPLNGLITDRPTMERLHRGEYLEVMRDFDVDYLVHYVKDNIGQPVAVYESKVIPDGTYKGYRIVILNFRDFPIESARTLN